jgi:hypothetical protein
MAKYLEYDIYDVQLNEVWTIAICHLFFWPFRHYNQCCLEFDMQLLCMSFLRS